MKPAKSLPIDLASIDYEVEGAGAQGAMRRSSLSDVTKPCLATKDFKQQLLPVTQVCEGSCQVRTVLEYRRSSVRVVTENQNTYMFTPKTRNLSTPSHKTEHSDHHESYLKAQFVLSTCHMCRSPPLRKLPALGTRARGFALRWPPTAWSSPCDSVPT